MSHQDSRKKSISRITPLVALSPNFTKQVNLQWGIVANTSEWCSETDPSILQHNRAPCQLLSRFSPTNYWDGHFREESRKKVTFLTSKRPSTNSTQRYYTPGILKLLKFLNFLNLRGGRLAPGARHCWAHFAIGLLGVFKIASMMANCSKLSFKSSEIGTLMRVLPQALQRSSVLPTKAFSESISNVNLSFCT